jgi:hypothetical protein
MSHRLTDWAMEVENLSTHERVVLLVLAYCCNGGKANSTCWPSLAYLKDKSGLSRSAIKRTLLDLERRALIDRKTGSGRATTVYRLACSDSPNGRLDLDDPTVNVAASTRGQAEPPEGPHGTPRGSPQNPQRVPTEQERVPTGPRTEERTRKGTGGKREARAPVPEPTAAKTLSLPPVPLSTEAIPDWEAIALELRPEIAERVHRVWKKFEVSHPETRTPSDWRQRWSRWVLDERQTRDECYTRRPENHTRPLGAFLGAGQPTDLNATVNADTGVYEV